MPSASIKGDALIAEFNAKVDGIAVKSKAKNLAADMTQMAPAAAPSGTQGVAETTATYSPGTDAAPEEEGAAPDDEPTPPPETVARLNALVDEMIAKPSQSRRRYAGGYGHIAALSLCTYYP